MQKPDGFYAGIVVGLGAALTLLAVANHPVLNRSHGDILTQVVALGPMDRFMHGSVIAVVLALVYGLAVFSLLRGFGRECVLAGFIAYALGSVSWVGAALVDGFLVPDIAGRFAGGSAAELDTARALLVFCAIVIQTLTKFGLASVSAGILSWSLDLLRSAGAPRNVGIIGLLAGSLPPIVVLASGMTITAHSLVVIVLAQTVWYFGIATLLIRRRIG